MRQPKTRVEVYAIKVTLLGTRPPVRRRILVLCEITLRNLHRTLQTTMGWTIPTFINLFARHQGYLTQDLELRARSQMRTELNSGN